MAMPIQEENVSMMDILNLIPVYPETIRLNANRKMALASELGICEDDKGRVSWISEEAKKNAIEKRILLKTQKILSKTLPNKNKNKLYSAFGRSQTLHEWADEYNMLYQTLCSRINTYGISLEEALTKPKQTSKDKVRPHI